MYRRANDATGRRWGEDETGRPVAVGGDNIIAPVAGNAVILPAAINLSAWRLGRRSLESVVAFLSRAWWILDTLSLTGTDQSGRRA